MNYDGKGRISDPVASKRRPGYRQVKRSESRNLGSGIWVQEPKSRMLKLTKKADHAHEGTRSASAKDVADSFGIPPEALAKILQRLVKAGLLHSQHGTNGG